MITLVDTFEQVEILCLAPTEMVLLYATIKHTSFSFDFSCFFNFAIRFLQILCSLTEIIQNLIKSIPSWHRILKLMQKINTQVVSGSDTNVSNY